MGYKVSFCIPSYNNVDAVIEMTNNLLRCNRDDIQVVICDDASKDRTKHYLNKIHDKRLKVFFNDYNIGAHRNWSRVMSLADAEYAYLVMGRDYLNISHIDKLLLQLSEYSLHDIKLAWDRKNPNEEYIRFYEKKIEALCHFIGFEHPTGLILKRDVLQEIKDYTKNLRDDITYPENYVKTEIIKRYRVASGYSGVFTDTEIFDLVKLCSSMDSSGDYKKMYFSPGARTQEAIQMIKMVKDEKECFNLQEEEYQLYIDTILIKLRNCIVGWKELCERVDWMKHYGLSKIMISREELLSAVDEAVDILENRLCEAFEIDSIRKFKIRCLEGVESVFSDEKIYSSSLKLRWFQECMKSANSEKLSIIMGEKKVAIYGYGEIGRGLCSLLSNSGVNVVGIIDKGYDRIYSKETIYSSIQKCPCHDVVIITPFVNSETIHKELSEKTDAQLISAEELIYSI